MLKSHLGILRGHAHVYRQVAYMHKIVCTDTGMHGYK